jgi:hypothetical protein
LAWDDGTPQQQLSTLVDRLTEKRVRIWLVIDTPAAPELDPLVAYEKNPSAPAAARVPIDAFRHRWREEQPFFASLARTHETLHVVDPSSLLCDGEACFGGKDGEVWYRDSQHLTHAGARRAKDVFVPIFEGVARAP